MGMIEGPGWAIMPDLGVLVTEKRVSHAAPKGGIGSIRAVGAGSTTARVMQWGDDDQLPNYREQLVAENNIVPSLIATRRDITVGRGLMAYKEQIIDGKQEIVEVEMPPEAAEFFEKVDIDNYLDIACRNDIFHSAIATEYIRGKGGQINSLRALECRHLRARERDSRGQITEWFWKGSWGGKTNPSTQAQRIPVYLKEQRQKKFITVHMDNLLCLDEYYPTPYWWGSEEWIRLANCVPEFHLANMKHGYSFRVHVEIPKDYFLNATPEDLVDNESRDTAYNAATAAKAEFIRRLNEVLQGAKNAGKTVVTEYDVDKALGKEYPGIKITPITLDLKDEALLKLFDASNAANMSAQGVHPTLANIQTQGKLSSGSEIRNAFLMYVAIKTPGPRRRLLRPIELVKRENNWPKDIKYGFRDMLITTLAEDKSGVKDSNQAESE